MLIRADARKIPLKDKTVQMVCTSPPYWGLRDYGVIGQIGLEKTPEEYVQSILSVMRDVWRVLRDDGTLWLNLGSSMWGGGRGGGGSYGPERPGWNAIPNSSDIDRNSDEPACGIYGKEPEDCLDDDLTSSDLCDGCRDVLFSRTSHNDSRLGNESISCEGDPSQEHNRSNSILLAKHYKPQEQSCPAMLGIERSQDPEGVQPLSSVGSMPPESFPQHPEGCRHCANCGACLNVLASVSRDSRLCVRRTVDLCAFGLEQNGVQGSIESLDNTFGTEGIDGSFDRHISDKSCDLTYPNSTIERHQYKPKDLVPIPWLVALALQSDGWYLRSDIIWSKPNPMPESVRDRPTKAHEYIFLLSKSERYYFDQEAVKEAVTGNSHSRGNGINPKAKIPSGWNTEDCRHDTIDGRYDPKGKAFGPNSRVNVDRDPAHLTAGRIKSKQNRSFSAAIKGLVDFRNIRSIWTIATQQYSGAHFATFPREIPERCIKAGSKPGDIILDPFVGSGTVCMVAADLGRTGIGLDLKYQDLASERIGGSLFKSVVNSAWE